MKKRTLKKWIKAKQLTQYSFSESVGIAQPTLCRVMAGDNWPTARTLGVMIGFTGNEVGWMDELRSNKALAAAIADGREYRAGFDAERDAVKLAKRKK